MPANGESVTISTVPTVPVDVSLSLLKRTMTATAEPTGPLFLLCL